ATAVDIRRVARRRRTGGVGRNLIVRDDVRSLPAILDSLHQDVNLLIRELTAGAERERWLRRPRNAGRNELAHVFGRNHAEIDWTFQRPRGTKASGLSVAPGAIPLVERCKRHALGRRELARVRPWSAGQAVASREHERRREDRHDDWLHRSPRPVASTPARSTNGRVCAVATGVARATTYPAVRPNAICDAMNHIHAMRAFKTGSTTPRMAQRNPVQSSGASRPPQRR